MRHKKNGGKTSTKDCVLLCSYHHQVVIRPVGLDPGPEPDGTTTAWNKDKPKSSIATARRPEPVRPGPPGLAKHTTYVRRFPRIGLAVHGDPSQAP